MISLTSINPFERMLSRILESYVLMVGDIDIGIGIYIDIGTYICTHIYMHD